MTFSVRAIIRATTSPSLCQSSLTSPSPWLASWRARRSCAGPKQDRPLRLVTGGELPVSNVSRGKLVMHGNIPAASTAAIKAPVRLDSEKTITVQMDSDDNKWFVSPARDLLGSDPGLALHVLTGISESSGYRYANGSRAVPGNLVRWLLRSDHGRQWLNAIMDGSTVEWWRDHQRAERIVFAIDQVEQL